MPTCLTIIIRVGFGGGHSPRRGVKCGEQVSTKLYPTIGKLLLYFFSKTQVNTLMSGNGQN